MAEWFSRKELYDLAWSAPMKTLAARFGISDVALKKTCAKVAVPVPGRGYWAKKTAGKSTIQIELPPRPPGMDDEVIVAGRGQYWHRGPTCEEILSTLPEPPEFEEPLEAVWDRIAKAIGKVTTPRNVRAWHPAIQHLLIEDERRRERQESSPYSYLSDAPIFDTPFERRRLRILNSLLLATAKLSGRPSVGDPEAREICITFHHQHVAIALDRPKGPENGNQVPVLTKPAGTTLCTYQSGAARIRSRTECDGRMRKAIPWNTN